MAQIDLAELADLSAHPSRGVEEGSVLRRIDPLLVLGALLLGVVGLLMVYSATNRTLSTLGENPGYFLKRQAVYLIVGVGAMVAAALVDYRAIRIYAPIVYLGCVALLLLVQTPLGTAAKGAQRAFQLGGFQFSPSMFTRLGLVVMLAAYLAEIKGEVGLRHVVRATALAALPMVLVFIQPDIGTTIILASILVALLIASGARARHLAVLALAGSLAIVGAFQLHIIKDYQIQRLQSFIDPQADVQRAGYNKQQAEGGCWGRATCTGPRRTSTSSRSSTPTSSSRWWGRSSGSSGGRCRSCCCSACSCGGRYGSPCCPGTPSGHSSRSASSP